MVQQEHECLHVEGTEKEGGSEEMIKGSLFFLLSYVSEYLKKPISLNSPDT